MNIYWYNGMGVRCDDDIDGHSGLITYMLINKERYYSFFGKKLKFLYSKRRMYGSTYWMKYLFETR